MSTTLTYKDRYNDWGARETLPFLNEEIAFELLVRLLEGSKTKQNLILSHTRAGMFLDKTQQAIYKMACKYAQANGVEGLNAYNLILNTDDKTVIYTQYIWNLKENFITDKDTENWLILLHCAYKKFAEQSCKSLEEAKNLDEELQNLQLKTTELKMSEVAMNYLLDYDDILKTMVKTYYSSIDALIGGFQPGNFTILAGATGAGKTCAMLNLIVAMAKHGKKVLLFSLEMTADELLNRIIAMTAGINSTNLRNRNLTTDEMEKYVRYTESKTFKILQENISIHTRYDITVEDITAVVQSSKADIVCIDYLGLIASNSSPNSYERVSDISRKLKILANTCKKPVIALHQLNRGAKDRTDKRPTLSDLRDSGKLEQDADTILFVYREAYYNVNADKRLFEVICAKSRHTGGAGKTAHLIFTGEYQRLTDPRGETQEECKQCKIV